MSSNEASFVETRMRKSEVSFTSTFSGISGFPDSVGTYTASPNVELDGKLWSLRIYPGGYDQSTAGFMSCMLSLESIGKTRASFRITVLNQKGWKDHQYNSDGVKDFLNTENSGRMIWGEFKFLTHNLLTASSNGICVDDKLIVRVNLVIYGEVEQIAASGHSSVRYPANCMLGSPARSKSLIDDLKNAVMDSSLADVTILCGGEDRIPAHKFILTLRSPVFRAMFAVQLVEASSNEIRISDFDGAVVRAFLHYLYTDEVPAKELEAFGELLLAAACKYEVPGLEALCENHLCATLTSANVVGVLYISDLHSAQRLKQRALMFIGSHAKELVQEEGFFEGLNMSLCQEVIKVLAGVSPEQRKGNIHQESGFKTPDRIADASIASSAVATSATATVGGSSPTFRTVMANTSRPREAEPVLRMGQSPASNRTTAEHEDQNVPATQALNL